MARKEYTLDEFEQELKNFVTGCGAKITNTNTEEVNQLFRNEAIVLRRIWCNEERECNITDYEKKYKEAIERAKDFMNGEVHFALRRGESVACWIFPELRESEDERIREWLIRLISTNGYRELESDPMPCNRMDILSWLERQKCPSQREIDDAYLKEICDAKHEIEKQKPVELGEVYEKIRREIIDTIHRAANDNGVHISECLENKYIAYLDMLKPVEWSEEDEKHITSIIDIIRVYETSWLTDSEAEESMDKDIEWLKSLKPQNRWKPSDEQLTILLNASNGNYMSAYYRSVLSELYRNLKEL